MNIIIRNPLMIVLRYTSLVNCGSTDREILVVMNYSSRIWLALENRFYLHTYDDVHVSQILTRFWSNCILYKCKYLPRLPIYTNVALRFIVPDREILVVMNYSSRIWLAPLNLENLLFAFRLTFYWTFTLIGYFILIVNMWEKHGF
jgi:hypothetical protein